MSTTSTNPTIPPGSPVPQWLPVAPTYTPSDAETHAVSKLQRQGAPQIVYYIDRSSTNPESIPWVLDKYHEIWFVTNDYMLEYHADARFIVRYPEVSLTEMKSSGVISS